MFIAGYFTVAMDRADADLTLLLIGWGFMLLSGLGLLILIIRTALKKPALRINADSLEYFNLFKGNKKTHIGWNEHCIADFMV
ncbi:hypothetical protein [Psychrobacter sp. FDAARGOS_221]|uniref:hypothetical protein n=1 Tax=Psychrobacter sp. FDAARGOS_221 TaxID=1975705 RepID=UPI000BB55A03|nr:hypothetical protein [Psychrobacter sp. FDAARGOS_221]PNK61328.1 hypothetical protein A6J60_010940 [Psychrobacter sp. FDAARGOS_221]